MGEPAADFFNAMNFASFDIETIFRSDLPAECVPAFDPLSVSLGNLKDPIKIEEKIGKARDEFNRRLSTQMSTHPDLCQVCCFVGYDSSTDTWLELFAGNTDEEFSLTHDAWEWMRDKYTQGIPLISFNGRNFDIPVLFRRAMLLDVGVPPKLYRALIDRYSKGCHHIDLMLELGTYSPFTSRPEIKGFEYYLKLFGLGGKPEGWDGSKIWPAFQDGWFEDIQIYCRTDVELLNALFLRVQPWIFEPARPRQVDQSDNPEETAKAA